MQNKILDNNKFGVMKFIPLFIVLLLMVGCGGPEKRCLVSPLSGTVVMNGEPVAGATVTRKYHSGWYNEDVVTVTHTDDKGYFQFDGAWKRSIGGLVHQPVILEEVVVEYNNTNYTVLDVHKRDYDSFGELYAVHIDDPNREDRLSKQNGKLYFKFDLGSDKMPIGRRK